jgi:hypothetical protein
MADWLKKVLDEVNREYNDLPEWKRPQARENGSNVTKCKNGEDDLSNIREPKMDP